MPVLAPTKVTVGDLAVITVTPAVHTRQEKRQALDVERAPLLKAAGVPSAAEAHALLARRRDLENTRRGILAELKALKAGDDPAAACAEVNPRLRRSKRRLMPRLRRPVGRLCLARQRLTPNGSSRSRSAARSTPGAATREEQQEAVEAAVASRSGAEIKLEMVRKNIAEDLALCPDADRAARDATMVGEVASCEAAQQNKATRVAAVRETAPDADEIERRELRCQRLEQALDNRNAELLQLEGDIGRLTGQIQAAGGDGVGEAHAAAQEQRILAERECARIQERVATLQLLRDTVGGCLTEGRERYCWTAIDANYQSAPVADG